MIQRIDSGFGVREGELVGLCRKSGREALGFCRRSMGCLGCHRSDFSWVMYGRDDSALLRTGVAWACRGIRLCRFEEKR